MGRNLNIHMPKYIHVTLNHFAIYLRHNRVNRLSSNSEKKNERDKFPFRKRHIHAVSRAGVYSVWC